MKPRSPAARRRLDRWTAAGLAVASCLGLTALIAVRAAEADPRPISLTVIAPRSMPTPSSSPARPRDCRPTGRNCVMSLPSSRAEKRPTYA